MNVVGIITEYNPMHKGHIYNIQKAKELTHADYVVIIMSGSFTEQGNVSVINKFEKARIAIENGADMVIELPTIHAVSSAEGFAAGAINILNSLGIITHLAFGAESENICELEKVAKVYLEHKEEIITKIKEYARRGINSAQAYVKIMSSLLDSSTEDISLPNNILGIEYLKALIALKSEIKPVLVHRLESSHNDSEISDTSLFASSTSIRNVLADTTLNHNKKIEEIKDVIPKNTCDYLNNNPYKTNNDIWDILKYEIIKLNTNGLKNIHEITEGLENKIYSEALNSDNYEQFIFNVKSKRYTLSKIKRICIYILLGITKEKYADLKDVNYARILKVKESSLELLSKISSNSNNVVVTKVTDDILDNLPKNIQESIKLDIFANNILYANNIDYTNKIIQP